MDELWKVILNLSGPHGLLQHKHPEISYRDNLKEMATEKNVGNRISTTIKTMMTTATVMLPIQGPKEHNNNYPFSKQMPILVNISLFLQKPNENFQLHVLPITALLQDLSPVPSG